MVREALWKRKTPWFLVAASLGIIAGGVAFLRPFLDSSRVVKLSEDATVQSVVSMGERLKKSWTEKSGESQPKYFSENAARLIENPDRLAKFLRDVEAMQKSADALAAGKKDAVTIAGHVFDVQSFSADYLAPGTPLKEASAGGGAGGPPGGGLGGPQGGNPSGGADPGAAPPTDTQAGPIGAYRLKLVLTTQDAGGLTFLYDSILTWMKRNAARPEMDYTLVNIPAVEEVIKRTIPATTKADGSPAQGGPAGQPPPPPPPPPGQGAGGNAQGGAVTVDQLAPLSPPKSRLETSKDATEYTIVWEAQLKPPAAAGTPGAAGESDKPKSGKESGK